MASVWQSVAAENIVRHSSGNYYLQAKVGGKKIRRSLKTKDLRIAKIKRDAALAPLRAAAPVALESLRTLGDAVTIIEARETGKAHLKPRTREYYAELFKLLRSELPLTRPAGSFSEDEARTWWKAVTKERSASQANNLLRLLRHACQAIVKARLRFDDPTESLRRMKVKKTAVETLPSREDFEAILADIRGQRKARSEEAANMAEFFAWSGMRKGEAQHAVWDDDRGDWFRIHGGEAGTKNGETRMLPVNPRLRALLDRIRPKDARGPIFSLKSPREALAAACARLEDKGRPVRHMRVHDLRHLFATMAIESGVDIPTVAKWLGHKDGGALAMRTYGHLRDEHSLAAAKKMA